MEDGLEHLNQHSYNMEKSDVTESDALKIERLVEPSPHLEAVRDTEKNSISHKTVNAEILTSGTVRETVNSEGDDFSKEPSRVEFSLQDTNKGSDGPSDDNNLHKQPREDRDEIEEADSELHKEDFQKDVKIYPSISVAPKDISQEYGRSAKAINSTIEETNDKSDDVEFKIPSVHSSPIADADIRDYREDDEGLSSTQRLGNNEECNKMESKTLKDGETIIDKFTTAEEVIIPDSENKDVNTENTDKIGSEVVEEKNIGEEILVCNQENQPMSDLRERKNSEPSTVNLDGSSPETTDGVEIVEERIEDGVTKKTENDASLKEAARQTAEIFDEEHEKGSDEKYFKLADEATEPTEMGISIEKGTNAPEKSIVYETNKDQPEINTTELDKSVQEVIDLSGHIEGTTLEECALEEQNRCIASVEENPSNHTIQTGYLVNTNPIENSDQALNENNRETVSERQIVEKGETSSEITVTATNEGIGANKDTNLKNLDYELDQRKHEKIKGIVPDKPYFQEIKDGSESEESKSTEKQSIVGKISTLEAMVETRVQTKDTENCGFQNPSDLASKEQHTEDDGRKTTEKETETKIIHEIQPLEDSSCMATEDMILETLKSGEEQEEATQEGEASSQKFVNDSIIPQLPVENSVKANESSSDMIDNAYTVLQIPIQNTTNVIEPEARESKGDAQGTEGVSEMPTQEQISELSNKIENAVTGIVKDDNNVILDTAISGKVNNEEATYLRNEKVDEICSEEKNGKLELHHIAQLTEKVHPINEEESKKLDEISKLNIDEGRYFEKVPDKADPSNEVVRYDVPVVSEDQVREGSKDNEKSSENPEDVSNTCTETIADIGPIDSGSGKDDVDDSSIVEASENEMALGASEVKTKKSSIEGFDEGTSVHRCNKDDPESSSLNSNFIAVSKETEESRGNNSIPEKENKDIQGVVLNVESSQQEEKIYVVEKADGKKSTQENKKLHIASESVLDDQIEETNSESVATNIHDSIDDDNPEKELINIGNPNDEPETANLRDEDKTDIYLGDMSDTHELAEGALHGKIAEPHEETTNSVDEEETYQTNIAEPHGETTNSVDEEETYQTNVAEENNTVEIEEEKAAIQKLTITSESKSKKQIEEIITDTVPYDIPYLIDADSPKKEILMVHQNDESEMAKWKDEDNRETNVRDINCDPHQQTEGTVRESVDNRHQETINSGFEEETYPLMEVEDKNEDDIKEKIKNTEKLEINSESVPEDQTEELNSESVATDIHDMIDPDNQEIEQVMKMVNLNDEPATVSGILDSQGFDDQTICERVDNLQEETTNSGREDDTHQTVNEDNNQVDVQDKNTEDQIEETNVVSAETNIHHLIDDDHKPETEIITMANLNDETEIASLNDESEIANLKDEDNETVVCDISHESDEGTLHDKACKGHDEITNFDCQDETQQIVNVEDSKEVDSLEENTDVGKLEVTSESAFEKLFEETHSESVATNIHDLIDDDNNPTTEIITKVNLNDETEMTNLKDGDKETVVCDISNSHESAKGAINDKAGKGHDEITNFDCQKETQLTVNVEDSTKVDILEEKTDVGKLKITSESPSQNLFEETRSESVATNIHDLIDDDNNSETEQIITMANLNDETEVANLKDEDKETVVYDISNSHESAEMAIHDKSGKVHDEITNFDCEKENQQTVNAEDNNEIDILEEKTDVGKLEITSESASKDLFEETCSESVTTNVHDLIDDDNNLETEEIITVANLNDETKIANLKDEGKETVVYDILNSHELAEGTIHDKDGKVNDEITNFNCKEETQQTVNAEKEETQQTVNVEDNNEVDILEEKTDVGKLKITSELASKKLLEETHSESVATNIHDFIDDDNNPEREQIITMASLNDETEKSKLEDKAKETDVCDTCNSHESVEGPIHDIAGEVHDETTTFECHEENQQSMNVEDSNEVDIHEEKTDVEKLETTLESKSEDLIEETRTQSVATNIHGLIDDDNNPETELITTMANLNDENEIAKMKEKDNKEMFVCDIPGLTEFVEGTIHDKVSKRHEETANFECQEETRQTVKAEDSNEVGNHEENKNVKKLEISSESVPEDQIEETISVPVVTNIHDSIDDGNPENEKNIKMINLNDEPETAKSKNTENKELNVGDISDSCEMVERMMHDRVGKLHEETTNSGCEEETSQMITVDDKHGAFNQEERTDIEKFEIIAKETNNESVATSIHDTVDDDNSRKEIVEMENLNDSPDSAIVKDEYNQEQDIGNISDIQKSVERTICDVLVKQHEETTYTEYEKNINQNTDSKEATEVVAQEEGESTKKLEMISNAVAEDQIQEMTCEAETMQTESTLGDCTSSEGGGPLTVSEIIYEDKKKKEPRSDFASSEARGDMDNQLAEKDKTYETSVTTYESNSQEKQKVFSMYDSRDDNQPKEQTSKKIIENPSSSPSEGLEESSGVFDKKQIKEDKAVIDDDSVGVRYETVDERSRDIGNNQLIEKAPHDPSEEQIHQGISEIDVNTTGSGVSKEDISDSALLTSSDLVKENTSTTYFSAEGDDCSHQEREQSKSLDITYSEEAKTIEEAESMPNKQPQNIVVGKPNEECEFSCEEDINSFESEKSKEEDKTDTEKAIAARLGTSSNMASEEPEAAIQTEPPWEQTKVATEAVKGNDKVVAESIITSQENSEIKTGQNSIEVDDEKRCDTVNDFSSANEASAERNIQKNASEEELEGLIHDIAVDRESMSVDETNNKQDGCVSSETKALEDETQDGVQPEEKVYQTIDGGESDKKESLEEKKTSEKNHSDVNFGKSLQEDENKEHEKVFVSNAAEGATSDELQKLASMTGCEKVEEMDAINKNTEKMVIGYSDTDTWVEQPTNVEASGYHSQMDKIETSTLENIAEKFQSVGTEDEEKHERTEELYNKLQEDSAELRKYEHIPTVLLERVKAAELSEKTERKITVEEDISEAPSACLKQETEDEHFPEDGTKVQKKESQTKCEIETTDTMVDESSNEEDKDFDSTPSKNFSRTIFTDKAEHVMEKLDERIIVEATPDAYMETEVSHEQFQKDDIVADNEKPQHKWELDSTYITKNQSLNDEVNELDCKPSEESMDLEDETALFVDLQDEKKNIDAAPGACMKDELRKDELDKENELGIEKKETQTPWEPNFIDKENEPSNNNVEEWDCIPTEQNTVIAFAEKLETTLLTNDESEKQCFDATIDTCIKDETSHVQLLKDGIKAEKNNEQETRWELQPTDDTEFDSSPSEENTFTTVWTEKIRNLLTEEDVKKNVGVADSSCAKHETNHEQFQTDDLTAEKNKEPCNKRELDRTDAEANESQNNEVNELESNFPEQNSVTILSTDKLDIGILMDEGNEKKNLALPHTTRPVEEIVHEVDPTNVVSKNMRSRSTQGEAISVNLSKETSPEDPTEVHKLDIIYADTGSIGKPINIDDITHDVNDRGEEVPEWAPKGVQVSKDSRTETLSQDERQRTGEESNLDSKMERMQQSEEDSNEGLKFDISQDEEKHRDCDDLPVSRLLLQHILRNNSDRQDQATNAGAEENIQEMNGKRIVCTSIKGQGETFSDELEESHETLKATSQLLEKEDIRDVQQNTASAVASEAETPQSSMSSHSLSESKDIKDNEQISKDGSISMSIPLKQVIDGTRISEDKAYPDELENTSDLVIDEVNHDRKEKTEISEVKDDENQNNLHGSSIFTVDEGVKDEVSSLRSDVSTRENAPTTTKNNGKSTTPDSENDQKDHSTIDEKATSNPENLRKDIDFSSMGKNYQGDNSHTKAEEKFMSVSETVGHTESILQSEETETNPQYNQDTKPYKPMREIHVHANEQALEIKPEATIRKEELREENDDEITEIAQNVDSYSSEEPNMSYSEEVQQSNIMSGSTNETLQSAARPLEENTTEISKDENQTKERADPQTEEDKTDEEKDEVEEVDDHKIEDGGQNAAVTVEERDAGSKKAHKKSHNILSGVGSKVKNSLAKVKKAIIGKSSQPKSASPK